MRKPIEDCSPATQMKHGCAEPAEVLSAAATSVLRRGARVAMITGGFTITGMATINMILTDGQVVSTPALTALACGAGVVGGITAIVKYFRIGNNGIPHPVNPQELVDQPAFPEGWENDL